MARMNDGSHGWAWENEVSPDTDAGAGAGASVLDMLTENPWLGTSRRRGCGSELQGEGWETRAIEAFMEVGYWWMWTNEPLRVDAWWLQVFEVLCQRCECSKCV